MLNDDLMTAGVDLSEMGYRKSIFTLDLHSNKWSWGLGVNNVIKCQSSIVILFNVMHYWCVLMIPFSSY